MLQTFDADLPDAEAGGTPAAARRRRKMWEIDNSWHCMIVGSCLDTDECRKLAARTKPPPAADATDFLVHGRVVYAMGKAGPAAKLAQKILDRKFRSHIRRCASLATEDDMRAYWVECSARGEFAGPFWALMSHPETTRALSIVLFGEMHMLSHLEGSTNRAFQRRLATAEREADAARRDAAAARERAAERQREVDRLREALRCAEAENRRLEGALERRARREADANPGALEARVAELERLAEESDRNSRAAAARLADKAAELRASGEENAALRRALDAAESECATLTALLRSAMPDGGEDSGEDGAARPIDLAGRGVVYVGGRSGLLGHFRTLVENANGRFIHHDGGIEDNDRKLGSSLGRGDAVLCPVDCVSHGACLRAKRFCKRTGRAFIPLRSSGLSAFADGLRRAATQ